MTLLQPLVSIVIITYNSEKYILETLESARLQSYPNLELIVSDDCSSDNTLNICKEWLSVNDSRFEKTALVTTNANSGIAPNCNRGVQSASGDWIKMIAGDDVLLPNCVSDNIAFVERNKDAKFVFSNMVQFTELGGEKEYYEKYPLTNHKDLFNTNPAIQHYNLIGDNLICPAPASFINRETLLKVGMFDERFPFIEDYPLWVNVTLHNYPLYYFDTDTVLYRKGESLTQTPTTWRHKLFYKSAVQHFSIQVAKELKSQNKMYYLAKKAEYFKFDILMNVFRNKVNLPSRSFNFLYDFFFLKTFLKLTKRKQLPTSYLNTVKQ